MQHRIIRTLLVVLLIVIGGVSIYLVRTVQQHVAGTLQQQDNLDRTLDAIAADLGELRAAQQAYVAPGQLDEPWQERVSALEQQLRDKIASLGSSARAANAASKLAGLTAGLDAF